MSPQQSFNEKYIAATEIMKVLDVTRGALLYARKVGKLPDAIIVGEGILFVWEREQIKPHLDAWQAELLQRRGH